MANPAISPLELLTSTQAAPGVCYIFLINSHCAISATTSPPNIARPKSPLNFDGATTPTLKKGVLEHAHSVITSAAQQPTAAVNDHTAAAYNTDKVLAHAILFRFAKLAHFDLPFAGGFGSIKSAVHNAYCAMGDLFYNEEEALFIQLTRVSAIQDSLQQEDILDNMDELVSIKRFLCAKRRFR
jgi:hypothetical protein